MTQKRRKTKRRLLGVFAFAVLAIGFYVFAIANGGDEAYISDPSIAERLRLGSNTAQSTPPDGFPLFSAAVPVFELTDTQYLKLVNRDLSISAPVCESNLRTVWPDMPARTTYVQLHETAFSAVGELFAAAERANISGLFIASGYRTQAEQSELYANAIDPAYVMPPGHSEHQLGLAADILSGDHTGSMRGTEEARWLAEHAPRFGLILRYPADKTDITGVPYEPWHFRYVGRVHAWVMGQHSFVLEEYIEFLMEHTAENPFFTYHDDVLYVIYYTRDVEIRIPLDSEFDISGNNIDGFIVTVWA